MAKPQKPYRHRTIGNHTLHPETLMMGYGYDPKLSEGSLKLPVFQTSTFVFERAATARISSSSPTAGATSGRPRSRGLIYSRFNNPNLEILEDRLAVVGRARDSAWCSRAAWRRSRPRCWPSCGPGDVILHSEPLYGGTETLLQNLLTPVRHQAGGLQRRRRRPGRSTQAAEAARAAGPIGAILLETPANPTNGLVDLAHCAAIAEAICPASQAAPAAGDRRQHLPRAAVAAAAAAWRATSSVYSLTKYVGGHSDLIAGGCLGAEARLASIARHAHDLGTMLDPHTCWLLMRSLETLKLRMTSADEQRPPASPSSCTAIPRSRRCTIWASSPRTIRDSELYRRQCTAPGSTFSFEVHGGEPEAFACSTAASHPKLAVSLGGTESLVSHPASHHPLRHPAGPSAPSSASRRPWSASPSASSTPRT